AEKRNISAAGRELGMAPAVASAKLAKLETTIGADLLHRSTRKVALSVEGAEFLPYAKEILAQENAARAALGFGTPIATGTLRFTAPSNFGQLHLAPVIPEFLALQPGITLDLRFSDSPYDLIEGSFDLALRISPLDDSSFRGRKLANETRILCASPAYLDRHGAPQRPRDLDAHHLVGFRDSSPKPLIGPDGVSATFDPRRGLCRLMIDDALSLKVAVIAGAGISITSIWSVRKELADGSLVRVLPDYQLNDNSALWLVYPKSNVLTAKVRVFIDFLVDKFGGPAWDQV
ncbi:MAG: LysR family transcriptional regulator, partial [Gammaproteobacteria bacterium]|nr:LysR family transcriptional regulator [Gammaproteobacteria bacterium]